MHYVQYNPNPAGKHVGDCTVRAISKALNQSWEKTYSELAVQGFLMGDMPSANAVWGAFLKAKGFTRQIIPDTCPECYTVAQFAEEHPQGVFILALSAHAVCVKNGVIYDSWNSGDEVPLYFWYKE